MARTTNKPAIEQIRDQSDIDHATSEHLSAAAQNIGFPRPPLLWSDDELFRAVARGAGISLRVVKNAFTKALTNILGPRTTQIGYSYQEMDLFKPGVPGRDGLVLVDRDGWPQRGTLTIDPSVVATEEVLPFAFLDPDTNKLTLEAEFANAHNLHLPWAATYLDGDHRKGVTSINVLSAANLPTIALTPRFAIVLGYGTPQERIYEVTTTAGNTLTLGLPLEYDYDSATPLMLAFLNTAPTLTGAVAAGAGALPVTDGRFFQNIPDGLYIVNRGGENEEQVIANGWAVAPNPNTAGGSVNLVGVTALDHAAGETVEYVQILVQGCSWNIFETQAHNHKLIITIPEDCPAIDFAGGAYLHEALDTPQAAVAVANYLLDNYIEVLHAVAWENMIGITDPTYPADPIYPMRVVTLDDTAKTETRLVARVSRCILRADARVGDTTLRVVDVQPLQDAVDSGALALGGNIVIDRGGVPEVVTVSAINYADMTLTISALAANHAVDEFVEPQNSIVMYFPHPVVQAMGGSTVQRDQTMYVPAAYPPGPPANADDLQDGNFTFTTGNDHNSYPGYFMPEGLIGNIPLTATTQFWFGAMPYAPDNAAIREIPGQQVLTAAVIAGASGVGALPLDDITLYPSLAGQFPYTVRINPGGPT